MAKIIKVASSTSTPRIANQFKTSRNSTTNPFKYQNFEGNTLDISAFADVFETSAVKDTNKLKMIASSVAGSMHRIKTGITEPIAKFVGRVRESISSAWDYAVNTNISDLAPIKNISEKFKGLNIHIPSEIPGSQAISSAIGGIKTRINSISANALDLGKGISSKWNDLISKLHNDKKISSEMSVSELETLWRNEISASNLEEAA